MIYYKNKINNEIYEVNNIHRKDDAFYHVFGNKFNISNSEMYKSISEELIFIDEDEGQLKYKFHLNYYFINFGLHIDTEWNKSVPLSSKIINLTRQNYVSSDSAVDLYYILYKDICALMNQKLLDYNINLGKFNFDNYDIFEIVDENSKEVKDFKVKNYFK